MKAKDQIWGQIKYKGLGMFVIINDPDKSKLEYAKERYQLKLDHLKNTNQIEMYNRIISLDNECKMP